MLKKITINNFKCLKKIELNNLKTFNVLSGKNSSGKTTILEILFLTLGRSSSDGIIRLLMWRGISNVSLDTDSCYLPLFNDLNLNNKITVELHEEAPLLKKEFIIKYNKEGEIPVIKNTNIAQIDIKSSGTEKTNIQEILEITYGDSNRKSTSKLSLNNNGITEYGDGVNIPTKNGAFISSTNRGNTQEISQFISQILINKGVELSTIIEKSKIIEPTIKNIISSVKNGIIGVYVDTDLSKFIPLELLGDGANRFIYLLTRIIDMKNGILLIDEIENGFHYSVLPSILKTLIETAKQYNCQIIATTHDYELLQCLTDSMVDTFEDDISYYRITKGCEQHDVQYFNYRELQGIIDNNLEVR